MRVFRMTYRDASGKTREARKLSVEFSDHLDRVKSYVDAGEQEGALLVADGRDVVVDGYEDGYFMGPTLFDNVTPEMSIYTDEIFGPVLSTVRMEHYEQAIDLINRNPYGNGTAVFTSSFIHFAIR